MLRRIPAASSVLRIELIRGGSGGTATGSYELVANVVRRSTASSSASYLAGISAVRPSRGPARRPDRKFERNGRTAASRRRSHSRRTSTTSPAPARLTEVEEDGEIEREYRDEREVQRTLSADAEYKTSLGGGELVGNFSLARERISERVGLARKISPKSDAGARKDLDRERSARSTIPNSDAERSKALLVQRMGWLRSSAEEGDEELRRENANARKLGRVEYRNGGDATAPLRKRRRRGQHARQQCKTDRGRRAGPHLRVGRGSHRTSRGSSDWRDMEGDEHASRSSPHSAPRSRTSVPAGTARVTNPSCS